MKKVLFLGAHADDIELGCGATIHKHRADWQMRAWVFSDCNPQGYPLVAAAERALGRLGIRRVGFSGLPTRYFAEHRQLIWESCAELARDFDPDCVFVNSDGDAHQDHRSLCEEALRKTFRCSIVSYDPVASAHCCNTHETVAEADVAAKLEALAHYAIYRDKPYFDPEYVRARLRVSGQAADTRYAEAFCIKRLVDGL